MSTGQFTQHRKFIFFTFTFIALFNALLSHFRTVVTLSWTPTCSIDEFDGTGVTPKLPGSWITVQIVCKSITTVFMNYLSFHKIFQCCVLLFTFVFFLSYSFLFNFTWKDKTNNNLKHLIRHRLFPFDLVLLLITDNDIHLYFIINA